MKHTARSAFTALFILAAVLFAQTARPDTCRIATATNFNHTLKSLQRSFQQAHSHRLKISPGSSGKLLAQIENGAPFDVFLSADVERPQRLVASGVAVQALVYARGQLVLWSRDTPVNKQTIGGFSTLALANPKLAPYGRAAMQTMEALGLAKNANVRLVYGENVAQAMQYVSTGAVPAGFVALAQVLALPENRRGYWWQVNEKLYDSLDQQAVLLKRGENSACAQAFYQFLQSPQSETLIQQAGYSVPKTN